MSGSSLCPEKALIFRIAHRDNVSWLLGHGLHCRNSSHRDPDYVNIGNPDLIVRRASRTVEIDPYGTLSDYVPFYFTPYSPMLYNIKTGYNGIAKRANEEIVILVSSLHHLREMGQRFLFTNRHAYLRTAEYFDDLARLDRIDWLLLRSRDFKRDPDDPDKFARYEAEALVHQHLPIDALLGIACYNMPTKALIDGQLAERRLALDVKVLPGWYL
ncbi:MAG: DUF4433 domain-containing protein [Xanthomonadaceae bacterium]|nr:DUF4433 domain-containing protein [Xanthomonadaceae bacterium]MDP2184477.1 DUF4433 domain-containing protein [Xanthomonadales bacterium]MDZ4116789.1 DUF4433 domain-containing protein [Xanthomonadaceae bacterium]MDZ4376866.1 DUF4433 domain-containing protein [Xanthomonadaceae bacterium]